MRNTCTCGVTFLDAEDWRDHMPCPGSATEQAFEVGAAVAFGLIGMALAIRENYWGNGALEKAFGAFPDRSR